MPRTIPDLQCFSRGRRLLLAPLVLLAPLRAAAADWTEAPSSSEVDSSEVDSSEVDSSEVDSSKAPASEARKAPAPAAEASPAPPPAPPPGHAADRRGEDLVALHFSSAEPPLRLFLGPPRPRRDAYGPPPGNLRLQTSELREICEAPCSRWVYPGRYTLGLARTSDDAAAPLRAADELLVTEPSLVTGHYRSYAWLRAVGWGVMGAGLVGGSLLVLSAFERCGGEGQCLQGAPGAWLGAGAVFAGVTGGLFLTLKGDSVSFTVTPAPGLSDPK